MKFPEIKKHLDWYIVLIFLAIRLIINLEIVRLSISFAVIYLIFITLLLTKTKFFSTLLILFLVIDSVIGTYLATITELNSVYYGTMLVNLVIISILIRNRSKSFKL